MSAVNDSGKTPEKTLDSWKEIASFLNRGVRTVQRWERTEGLPVRRHKHLERGTVFAHPSELKAWQRARELGFQARRQIHAVTMAPVVEQLDRLRALTMRQAALALELRTLLAMRGRIEHFYGNGFDPTPVPPTGSSESRRQEN